MFVKNKYVYIYHYNYLFKENFQKHNLGVELILLLSYYIDRFFFYKNVKIENKWSYFTYFLKYLYFFFKYFIYFLIV